MAAFDREEEMQPVTWRLLPQKPQLGLLFFTRFMDIFQAVSIQSYVFYFLRNFDTTVSNATNSSQAGILLSSFTGAQLITTLLWARTADSKWIGRKGVILVGIFGTALSCLGFGFARSFREALVWRVLGGALNALPSIVGVMTSEIVEEKRLKPLAFLLQPMSFGVAAFIGPAIGGLTADPVSQYHNILGPGSILGGKHGIRWMTRYPFALPNILSAGFLILNGVVVLIHLKETLKRPKTDIDTELNHMNIDDFRRDLSFPNEKLSPQTPTQRIWTSKFIFTLVSLASFDFHTSAFNTILPLFLSTPPTVPSALEKHNLPFVFSGGLSMSSSSIGLATALIGAIGLIFHAILYPPVHHRLGTLSCYRTFSPLFVATYTLLPYVAFGVSLEEEASFQAWGYILLLLLLHVTGRTFVLPTGAVLLNDCSTTPSSLTRVHAIGQVVSSASRTLGGVMSGYWYGIGLRHGVVGAAWWAVSFVALLGWLSSRRIPH
ncbi:major facilitator superfamily transporter [Phlyctema vagabunda]|uniref:Major facilitator superfamily transporter n=1 Tax=Phlyctema vagabunda TaxID=108571 RepID=A0ABR4PMF1_9HELO